MRRVTINQAVNGLGALIDLVRAGESVHIVEGGTPVARLVSIVSGDASVGRVERLERAGLLRRGLSPPPVELISRPGPAVPDGFNVVDALLEERREGR